MINLLDETIETLANYGKTPNDVLWTGTCENKGTWNDFAAMANHIYDAGYGKAEVDMALLVVGDGWWLERWEDRGKEQWAFETLQVMWEHSVFNDCRMANIPFLETNRHKAT